jgi:polysaccharide biosynthesis/export protein
MIPLTAKAVSILEKYEPHEMAGAFTDQRPPAAIKFGAGDVVSVTIFEAAAGGLFIPIEAGVRPGNFVQIPDQTIDLEGNISVPFAGAIRAAGRTNVEVQTEIVDKIKKRAIEPQVVVNLSQQRTSMVSVLGEVNAPLRYPASAAGAGDRILDAITRAGGIKGQGFETWVMLDRKGQRATVPFANLVSQSANNIYVQPGDRIYVFREQQKFLAFGASGQQGEFNFDAWRISLAEAVGKAGGLLDNQANADAVYFYRMEPRRVAKELGIDVSKYETAFIPVIFNVRFRDPAGFFLANNVQMRNHDVVYVANASSVELSKLLQLVNLVTTTSYNVATAR